jgi:hypothetical protein
MPIKTALPLVGRFFHVAHFICFFQDCVREKPSSKGLGFNRARTRPIEGAPDNQMQTERWHDETTFKTF